MPTVPRYDSFQATSNTLPQTRLEVQQMPDVAGQQAQQTGRAMLQAGDALGRIAIDAQHEANTTVAKDLDAQATAAVSDVLYHPETGFMAKQGKDVIASHDEAIQNVRKIQQDAINSVQNTAVRQMLVPVLAARAQHTIEAINRHAGQETQKYQIQTADSRAVVSLQDAALNYQDDKLFERAIDVTRGETASLAKLNGWDEATARLQATKYQDTGYKMRYEAWRIKDPVGAFTNFQQNAEQISPLVRDQIGHQLFQAAAPVLAQQLNQVGGAGIVAPAPADGSGPLPRGIRNNNPGNIAKGPSTWQDEVQGNDPKYVSFATPEAGIRAMGKTLLNYQDKHGLNTVESIISRWAPATENDTATYAGTVAKALGVKADTPIDLHDSTTLTKLTKAMIQVENGPGASRITNQQIALGLAAADGGAPLPAATPTAQQDPAAQTGLAVIDALPADWKLHVMQLARAQSHQDMALARESLRGKVQDATAEYMTNGMASKPPNEAEFIRAYGQAEGVEHYRDFQNVAVLGQTLQQVKTLPTAALTSMLESSKPAPGDGFAARQHNYEILTRAISQVQQARSQDPVEYALTTKSYGLSPIKNFDLKTLSPELTRRATAAAQMANDYGTTPQLLTKPEAKTLSATLKAVPVEDQKKQLATVFQSVGDMGLFKKTMQEIAPDSPTLAVAGIYQARGLKTNQSQDVADLILRGQAILTPNTKTDGSNHEGGRSLIKMPEEKLMLSDWNSVTGDAFKGKEQASDLFQQTAKAIYAARSAEEGDYSGVINSKRWKASIMLATGGIESHNGSKIVLPYGLGYDQFQDALKVQTDRIVKAGGALNTTANEMMRLPLENIGDGRYLFRRGAGYLVGKDGLPVVADLSGGR